MEMLLWIDSLVRDSVDWIILFGLAAMGLTNIRSAYVIKRLRERLRDCQSEPTKESS